MTTYPNDQGNASGAIPVWTAHGPVVAPVTPSTPFPGNISASPGNYSSGVLGIAGSPNLSVGATLSTTGNLTVTRYIDAAGNVTLDATTSAMTANTPAAVKITDHAAYSAFKVAIANSGNVTGNLSNAAILAG